MLTLPTSLGSRLLSSMLNCSRKPSVDSAVESSLPRLDPRIVLGEFDSGLAWNVNLMMSDSKSPTKGMSHLCQFLCTATI